MPRAATEEGLNTMQKSVSNETVTVSDNLAGGFFARLAAVTIDYVIIGLLLGGAKLAVFFASSDTENPLFTNILFKFDIFDIIFYLLTVGYFIVMTYCSGATLGKKLLNLSVVAEDGGKPSFFSVLYRETVGKYLSAICFVGYLLVLVNKDKRGLHDILAGTKVVYSCKIRTTVVKRVQNIPVPQYGYQQPVQPQFQPQYGQQVPPMPQYGQQVPPPPMPTPQAVQPQEPEREEILPESKPDIDDSNE